MNREIKFRAWDDGKMIYQKDIAHLSLEDYEVLRLAKWFCNIRNDAVTMQYTGLKDRNGKEIYEGDILKRAYEKTPSFLLLVSFNEFMGFVGTTYPYRNHTEDLNYMMRTNGAEYTEIIGNIYENPELLKP